MPTETAKPRLIDANALLAEMNALNKMNPDFVGAPWNTIDDAILLVNSAPTVETTDDVLARIKGWVFIRRIPERYEAAIEWLGFVEWRSRLEALKKLEESLNRK